METTFKERKQQLQTYLKGNYVQLACFIFGYYIFTVILSFLKTMYIDQSPTVINGTFVTLLCSIIDMLAYSYIIHFTGYHIFSQKGQYRLKNGFIFSITIVCLEQIFQSILYVMSGSVQVMIAMTLALSILRLLYIPFLHFYYYSISIHHNNIRNSLKLSFNIIIKSVMNIMYFSVGFYFLHLVYNYIHYQLMIMLNIPTNIKTYEVFIYGPQSLYFIALEIIFYLLLTYLSMRLFSLYALLFQEETL